MRSESAAWAKGATGKVPVFFGNGKGRIFLNDELPELLKREKINLVIKKHGMTKAWLISQKPLLK